MVLVHSWHVKKESLSFDEAAYHWIPHIDLSQLILKIWQ